MLHHTVTYVIAGEREEIRTGFWRPKTITPAGCSRIVAKLHNANARIGAPKVRPSDVLILRVQCARRAQ